jgi:uncharacterized membrane protein
MKNIWFYMSGLGWIVYSYYDWIIMGHQINVGYPNKSMLDLLNFIFPLLSLLGLVRIHKNFSGKNSRLLHNGIKTSCVGLIFMSLGKFGGEWIFHAPFPIYMLLFFIGSILVSIGLCMSLSLSNSIIIKLVTLFVALLTVAYPIFPQLFIASSGALVATNIKGYLGIMMGLLWILFGLSFDVIRRSAGQFDSRA